jgi:ubiquitin carboxyl-terminal hydrolase 10
MPGPYMPGRRQAEQQYYHHHIPPQTHSPVHHNPYAAPYHHLQQYGPPHGYPQHMQPMQQWYPYQQPPPPPQYAMPPRQFQPQPHASPVVVSSHLHMVPPVNRAMGQTPPIVHSRTPPVPRMPTPQQAPPTPSVQPQAQVYMPSSAPQTTATVDSPPAAVESKPTPPAPSIPQSITFKPFYPPLPWLSVPESDFPARTPRGRRRRRAPVSTEEQALALPSREQTTDQDASNEAEEDTEGDRTPTEGPEESQASTVAGPSDAEVDTPSTSHPPSEVDLAQSTTPSTVTPSASQQAPPATAAIKKHARNPTIPAVPRVPIKPAKASSAASTTQQSIKSPAAAQPELPQIDDVATTTTAEEAAPNAEEKPKPAAPKSWAELLRVKNAAKAAQPVAPPATSTAPVTNGPVVQKSNTLADVLASFSVDSEKKVSFIEPRGLVNSGNLCYMNSVCLNRSSSWAHP